MSRRGGLVLWLVLLAASSATLAGDVASRLLVQTSPVAGFQFHEGKAVWGEMRVGDALTLVREPENPHDGNAVRVEWRGHHIGYVPRRENAAVARLLDRGTVPEARVVGLQKSRDPWRRVLFEITLEAAPLPAVPAPAPMPYH